MSTADASMKNFILEVMAKQLLPMWKLRARFMTINLLWGKQELPELKVEGA